MIHSQFLVSRSNLFHNFSFFKSKLYQSTKLLVMVKANAYGHGDIECSKLMEEFGADYLGVALPEEGIKLKNNGINLPIIILSPGIDNFAEILKWDLEPSITDFEVLNSFIRTIDNLNPGSCNIHIKLDSGMNRLGFKTDQLEIITDFINRYPQVRVKSLFSHLAAAEDQKHDEFTLGQINLFSEMCDQIEKKISYRPFRHILNSTGTERFPSAQMDMVRLGVGIYGTSFVDSRSLKAAGSLRAPIVHIHTVKDGTIGYGRYGVAGSEGKSIAVIPLGYADGIDRHLGRGAASFLLNGHRVPTIGNICMDCTLLDITGVEAKIGDPVTLFGEDPTVYELAEILGTITYEIYTSVHPRVARIVVP
ncbi:MAG: alanine racemase [Bacteroidales bacterium]|nr:alanine racemase [Bacteroidales bacterium]MDD2424835.1 alanine racemase [Bacteroidales bacterium]MDD3989981.1 alanine racemase [Bacteroidales bacterium]